MGYYPYDSRNPLYRNHFGAVAAGTPLRLRLLLHNDARVHTAYLSICRDGEAQKDIPLSAGDALDEYRFYECEITLDEGLYWYSFFYDSDYGRMYVTRDEHSQGTISQNQSAWQQTVYKADFKTPDWIKGGIIYQIFPDRFYKSGKVHDNVPEDRYLQDDWYAQPAFRQTNEKNSLGNDYFGGDLCGIKEKLPYIKSLGVNCIYLNPIFEAHSNHRYNTADYLKIDACLGSEEDLRELCLEAEKLGIYVILDGVFSHTGDDSVYFNKHGRYESLGAYNDYNSPYRSWFNFHEWRDRYSCWWGVPSLPETNENDESFSQFITGDGGVLQHWLDCGIKGWRLDVADELPDEFLDKIRASIKKKDPNAYLLGEVWEDATNKVSYGYRRRYLRGDQLDSVMNYPLANEIINFVKGENCRVLIDLVLTQIENYPLPALSTLMNHLGTHDTVRVLTRLGSDATGNREWQSYQKLSPEALSHAKRLLRLAATLQYTLPGIPSLYYGDEAGMEGYGDPFCRAGYPWGKEDADLLTFYRKLGEMRRENKAFSEGEFIPLYSEIGYISFIRRCDGNEVFVCVNRWHEAATVSLPDGFSNGKTIFGNEPDGDKITVDGFGISVIVKR